MSGIRKTHRGYFGIAMALAVAWYLLLGLGFTVLPAKLIASENYTLVAQVASLRVWGPIYIVVGLGLLLSASWSAIPHVFVRIWTGVGMAITIFWLQCFIASAFLGYLDAFTFIPAFATLALVEYRALIEPEKLTF